MSCVSFVSPEQRARLAATTTQLSLKEVQAQHPSPPVTEGTKHRIKLMATSADPVIRASAGLHRHAPDEVLTQLADDTEVSVRCAVARNQGTPTPLLRQLAKDPSDTVRGWVAAHESTPADLLDAMSEDPAVLVREVVAWNRRWPAHT